jgi:hypothetical protein
MTATFVTANEGLTIKSHMGPNLITFTSPNEWVMRITADRRIEVNEDVAVSDAAQAVLAALAPMLRPWVGLTEDEAAACWSTSAVKTWKTFEAKLKEKNSG